MHLTASGLDLPSLRCLNLPSYRRLLQLALHVEAVFSVDVASALAAAFETMQQLESVSLGCNLAQFADASIDEISSLLWSLPNCTYLDLWPVTEWPILPQIKATKLETLSVACHERNLGQMASLCLANPGLSRITVNQRDDSGRDQTSAPLLSTFASALRAGHWPNLRGLIFFPFLDENADVLSAIANRPRASLTDGVWSARWPSDVVRLLRSHVHMEDCTIWPATDQHGQTVYGTKSDQNAADHKAPEPAQCQLSSLFLKLANVSVFTSLSFAKLKSLSLFDVDVVLPSLNVVLDVCPVLQELEVDNITLTEWRPPKHPHPVSRLILRAAMQAMASALFNDLDNLVQCISRLPDLQELALEAERTNTATVLSLWFSVRTSYRAPWATNSCYLSCTFWSSRCLAFSTWPNTSCPSSSSSLPCSLRCGRLRTNLVLLPTFPPSWRSALRVSRHLCCPLQRCNI